MDHGPDISGRPLRRPNTTRSSPGRRSGQRELAGALPTLGTLRSTVQRTGNIRTETMSQTTPWHSIKEAHYHNNNKCGPGSEIPPHNRMSGTGGKRLCRDCADLNARGK